LIGGGAAALVVGIGGWVATRGGARLAGTTDGGGAYLHDWIQIGTDGAIRVRTGFSEMGQGVATGVASLIAEELGCRLDQMNVETGLASDAFLNLAAGRDAMLPERGFAVGSGDGVVDAAIDFVVEQATQQVTGGSSAMEDRFLRARQAGALARSLLAAAAARSWGVEASRCEARDGAIWLKGSTETLGFGALALAALEESPPAKIALKPRADWTILGKPGRRVDLAAKVDGSAIYGIDVRRPNMVFAAIANSPTFGGALKSFDDTKIKSMPGVVGAFAVPGGVAAVADSTWRAKSALAALPIVWDAGPAASLDSAAIAEMLKAAIGRAKRIAGVGDFDAAFAEAARTISADYSLPYLAHATMEPMNCTAEVRADGVEVWAPTQSQTLAVAATAKVAGVAESEVRLHTTYLGGGFGRRLEIDYVEQAVTLAKALRRPVQAIWSREEDMSHDFYRPAALIRMRGALDAKGKPTALGITIASQSILARVLPIALWLGPDEWQSQGVLSLPYSIGATRNEAATIETAVPVGSWRSVGHSSSAFAKECFIDELAGAAGADPLAFRLDLLRGEPRLTALLTLAAETSGWGAPLAKGRGRGLAVHTAFGTAVAEIVEAEVDKKGALKVTRVVAAVDCGTIVNPDIARAQIEGAIIFGLSAALFGKITIRQGRVEQTSFPDYEVVRMAQAPTIEVHLVDSDAPPGGIGEPGLPPLAPALANAIFAATGRRIRALPLVDQGFAA
jgi:isoquinoline 1-oxidoreductase beta subunit